MKIGLVGWGVETQSAYRYYGNEHSYIICSEEFREDFPQGDNIELHYLDAKRQPGLVGNATDLSYLDYLEKCDLIMYQGAARKNLEKKFPEDHSFWTKAKTTLHIFFENVPRNQIIGVTGTKGKGTTSTLIAKLLEAAGKKVWLAGNIGIPVLDFMNDIGPDDLVVLEISNFQLYKFPYSPHIAVHLMMMPEHIDEWHKTMEDYVEAKRNIFSHQTSEDIAVFYPKNDYSADNSTYSKGTKIPYGEKPGAFIASDSLMIDDVKLCSVADFGLLGEHNQQNICAAVTAMWQIVKDKEAVKSVVTTFRGLEHRLQLVRKLDGVSYYDDSFGTTPDTAVVAMNAFTQPKIMIVGGHDKGNPMQSMTERLVGPDIKHVIFIGTTGGRLRDDTIALGLDESKTTVRTDGNSWTMQEIVDTAREHATQGDVILLSTGSASFGLFNDYKDRGNQFIETVIKLL